MENKKELLRLKRHKRLRMRVEGSRERPRLAVHRSLNHLYAQVIDDGSAQTLFSLSTRDKEIKVKFPSAGNIKAAGFFGEVFAKKAKEKGLTKFVFDRAGYRYQGRVKAFTEGLRKGGLQV